MQVSPMISTLLAGLIILLSLHAVDSLSVSRRSEPKLYTIPLKPISPPSNIHPHILMQKRINNSIRRLARMTGNHNVGEVLEKRFNQHGVVKPRQTLQEDGITTAKDPTAPNSLGLDIAFIDTAYLGIVLIGTPPRKFEILMDSGSSDFWVGSESCSQKPVDPNNETIPEIGCGLHNFLGPDSSSSFKTSNLPFSVTYGTGSVDGTIMKDNVDIAGLKLTNHTFGTANLESIEFTSSPFDGLMGLARSTLSQQGVLTPIEALKKKNLVSAAIVSYKLGRIKDGNNDGEITFGGVDPAKFDPNSLVNLPNVSPSGFWECIMGAISVDGQDLGFVRKTILDTGTTLIIVPQNDSFAIHSLIPGAKQILIQNPDGSNRSSFSVPCDTNVTITMTFGGKEFPIDSRDIPFQPLGNGDCSSGISEGSVGGQDQWLVGAVFLKNAYFVTDFDKNLISLANLV